eukprot:4363201-Alexandrium_andersonii.AAC.1
MLQLTTRRRARKYNALRVITDKQLLVCLSVCVSVCVSVCLYVCASVRLSVASVRLRAFASACLRARACRVRASVRASAPASVTVSASVGAS